MKNLITSFLCFFVSLVVCMGQDIAGLSVVVDGNSYYEMCNGSFVDRGSNGDYRNNEDYSVTICPQNHDLSSPVVISFTDFNLEEDFDFLEVFDESRSQAVPDGSQPPANRSIGKFTGTNSPGTIRSSRGCLTFRFTSDSSIRRSGWRANIKCSSGCEAEAIRCGETITSNTRFGSNNWERYDCSTGHSWEGPELVYKVTTSKRGDLVATLTTNSSLDLDIFILSSCSPNSCEARNINPVGSSTSIVRLNDAASGDYYIVIDGEFSNSFGSFNLKVDCEDGSTPPSPNPPSGCLVHDDFEFYRRGDEVSSENPNIWKRWNSRVVDGIVSMDVSATGKQAMEINRNQFGEQDVILKLGNRSNGIYKVSWDMYINHGDVAYYNIQRNQNALESGGVFGGLRFVTDQWKGFWFTVELYFDLDRNRMKAFANNREIMNKSYNQHLGGINFYAVQDAHFYVDNACLQEVYSFPFASEPVANSRSRGSTSLENLGIESNPKITKANTIGTIEVDHDVNNNFRLFPNPTNGTTVLTLDLPTEEEITISIINQTGQLVKQTIIGTTQSINQQLDLSVLPNGMYLIRLDGLTFHQISKILKQE